jgi:hypothetical protein
MPPREDFVCHTYLFTYSALHQESTQLTVELSTFEAMIVVESPLLKNTIAVVVFVVVASAIFQRFCFDVHASTRIIL